MTSFSTWIAAIQTMLQTALGVELVAGVLNGPQARELGCVWSPGKARGDPATDELIEARVRIFQGYDEAVAANREIPWDPTQCYQWSDQIQAAIRANYQATGGWFIWWESTQIDSDEQAVEVVIMGRQGNLAETTG